MINEGPSPLKVERPQMIFQFGHLCFAPVKISSLNFGCFCLKRHSKMTLHHVQSHLILGRVDKKVSYISKIPRLTRGLRTKKCDYILQYLKNSTRSKSINQYLTIYINKY